MSGESGGVRENVQFAAIAIEESRRTLVVHPSNAQAVRDAMGSEFYTVVEHPAAPLDKILVVDRGAIEAATREAFQRASRDLMAGGGEAS